MAEKRCKHKNLGHVETIEAYHQTDYTSEGEVVFNNEYGYCIRRDVRCYDCRKYWKVVPSAPKFVKAFNEKVMHDRDTILNKF